MKNLISLLLLFIAASLSAQNPTGEIPLSITADLALPSSINLPYINNTYYDTLKYYYEEDSVNHEPPIAVGQELYNGVDEVGQIDIAGTTRVWRAYLNSATALGVRLYLEQVCLLPEEKLFFYSVDSNNNVIGIDGAFTKYHNTLDSFLVSPWYEGSRIIVEYNGPVQLALPKFKLSFLMHDFKKQSGGINGATLGCHNDVNCQPEDPWCNEIRSVCRITFTKSVPVYKNRVTGEFIENRRFTWNGTGSILNNSNNDFRPLILTARHVIRVPSIFVEKDRDEDAVHPLANVYVDFSKLIFEFNFQHRECDQGYSPRANDCSNLNSTNIHFRVTGCQLLEDESGFLGCDLALLELNQKPPLQYNVYYSGWDRNKMSDVDKNVTGIHHPRGDLKKISHGEIDRNFLGLSAKVAVKWNTGVTEQGSSGSPLFRNDVRRVIGALSWGFNDDCNDKAQRDRYGKLRSFWSKVSDELAPDNNDRNLYWGNDPIGACQDHLELNTRFLPASIYRLYKPDISIHAAQTITIANKEKTNIVNLCFAPGTFNSDYTFTAGQSISIKGNAGGFQIPSGAMGSFRIEACNWYGGCDVNYFSSPPPLDEDLDKIEQFDSWDDKFNSDLSFSVYPNPSNGAQELNVHSNEPLRGIQISNVFGKQVYSNNLLNGQSEDLRIPIDEIVSGVYFVSIRTGDQRVKTRKIIITQ